MNPHDKAGEPVVAPAPAVFPSPDDLDDLDAEILAIWRAMHAFPSVDARRALNAIDRLLDQRLLLRAHPGDGTARPPGTTAQRPGPAAQRAVLEDALRMLLSSDPE